MVNTLSSIMIDQVVLDGAERIREHNFAVNTPAKYQKRTLLGSMRDSIVTQLSAMIGVNADKIDAVYFSSPNGAEPHRDLLSSDVFETRTFIMPVILPERAILIVGNTSVDMSVGGVYEFDHETVHSLEVSDTSGCVLIMAAILK